MYVVEEQQREKYEEGVKKRNARAVIRRGLQGKAELNYGANAWTVGEA